MNAYLMSPASFDLHFDQREPTVELARDALQHLDVGDSRADAFAFDGATRCHAGPPNQVPAYWKIDGDILSREAAMDESKIGLFKLAGRKHLA
jgi:hypothetical protein